MPAEVYVKSVLLHHGTDPDCRNCEPFCLSIVTHHTAPQLMFSKLRRTLHFACLYSLFVLFVLTCVLLLLCDIRLQFENYVDCWPQGVFCVWTRLNCAPVFSTFFLLSIGQDRGIVLRETYYIGVSKPCAAELLALREANCAATTGSAQAGSVRCFQARLFYSDRLHRPPQGIPSGWTRRCRRSGFWFLISVFILTYIYLTYIYTILCV